MESLAIDLSRSAARVVAPPPKLTVSQWADAERRLSPESSAEPGLWRTARALYQRGVMDAVNEEGVHTVVYEASAQVGKTETILNILGFHIHHDPSPILLVQPTLDLAEAFSKDRLAPMVRDTPAIQDRVKDARSRDSGNTLLHKKFPGGHITLSGANSPSSLASRPIRIVLCDEIDRYPKSAGTEGSPVRLAEKRSTTFYNRILFLCSTPTIEGESEIDAAYQASDRRRYFVPCPECEHLQVLKFPSLKWDTDGAGQPINVRYLCESCGKFFDDSKKDWMLLNGKWIAEAPFTGVAGFHINELYSPWVRWVKTISNFLDAKKKGPEDLKVWVNTALGETWKEKGDAPEWDRLYHMREDYPIGTVPDPVIFLTGAADIQKDRIEVEIVGWGIGKQSWSVDYEIIYGDPDTEDPWKKLDEIIGREYLRTSNREAGLPIRMFAVDSGDRTQRVYNFVRRYPITKVIAVKGNANYPALIGSPSIVDINLAGRKIKKGARVWPVGTNLAKSELYSWLGLKRPTDEKEAFPNGYCHFPQYGEEYFKMLTAEQLVTKVIKFKKIYEWQKIRPRNEALDLRVYNRACAYAIGMDRWTEEKWLEQAGIAGVVVTPEKEDTPAEADQPQEPKAESPDLRPREGGRRKPRPSSFWRGR